MAIEELLKVIAGQGPGMTFGFVMLWFLVRHLKDQALKEKERQDEAIALAAMLLGKQNEAGTERAMIISTVEKNLVTVVEGLHKVELSIQALRYEVGHPELPRTSGGKGS